MLSQQEQQLPTRRDLANAIRALAMDAVQAANSGHPGAPMGMADLAEVLWNNFLSHNPANPQWADRDRFVLSNGHGSMLLYALLHLSGYDLSIDDLKQFRQLHSKTPGHPEYGDTPGVETTTGPLGQGLANAVGMALAERKLAAEFNRDELDIINHYTYVALGDGCLMEGISHEACSLAGTLGLGKLIGIYDDNGISIDGEVDGWFTDDTAARFEAYGWQVLRDIDGHDADAITVALAAARAESDKPSLLCCKTVIAWGSPNKQGTADAHGAALGVDEIELTRNALGWEYDPFVIPDASYAAWDARAAGAERETKWQQKFDAYAGAYPDLAAEFERRMGGELPDNWDTLVAEYLASINTSTDSVATRKSSQATLAAYGPHLPELLGGSADLTGSVGTLWSGCETLSKEQPHGSYIYYGVREFAMSAIMNGLALHGGVIPYAGTFLVFSDYARNAVRLAALMGVRTIFVYTHDSIGLGEDGPTHQAVEHVASLRLIPNLSVWRPCDQVECAIAWKAAIENQGPTVLVLTRQNLPAAPSRSAAQLAAVERGGYVLLDPAQPADTIVIATGSEVQLAIAAAAELNAAGQRVRVVSMPAADVFDQQDDAYRESVLPSNIQRRVAIEAGSSDPWYKYVGLNGKVVGIDEFGASAPGPVLFEKFGFTADNLIKVISTL